MGCFPDSPFELYQPYPPAGDQPEAIEQLVEGFNDGEVFQTLLGVTGSGKTFTLFGPENDPSLFSPSPQASESAGIIPRAVRDLFAALNDRIKRDSDAGEDQAEYSVFCSFLQVWLQWVAACGVIGAYTLQCGASSGWP